MDTDGENFRGLHAQQMLTGSRGWTLEKLQAAAYDSYQPGFAVLIPSLLQAYDMLPTRDPRYERAWRDRSPSLRALELSLERGFGRSDAGNVLGRRAQESA